jgi:hypothetical protein
MTVLRIRCYSKNSKAVSPLVQAGQTTYGLLEVYAHNTRTHTHSRGERQKTTNQPCKQFPFALFYTVPSSFIVVLSAHSLPNGFL